MPHATILKKPHLNRPLTQGHKLLNNASANQGSIPLVEQAPVSTPSNRSNKHPSNPVLRLRSRSAPSGPLRLRPTRWIGGHYPTQMEIATRTSRAGLQREYSRHPLLRGKRFDNLCRTFFFSGFRGRRGKRPNTT